MKKLLSVLLIVSTLFLSIGLQSCFAKYDDSKFYYKYSNSQNFEENEKNAEIKKLKKRLKKEKAHAEQLEKEKKEKEANKPSLWSRIKNKFSFFFSSYAGTALAAVAFVGFGLGLYGTAVAGYECYNDENCKFCAGPKGNSFLSHFKNVNYTKAFNSLKDVAINLMKNSHFFEGEVETKNK